ncbi:gibberellin 2-beta-dioxygenase 8-like [Tasmannia lanceolata]|uniref:gibberellin 2-beta-dioxygenase 8-like n=1 Tax=Tasmannia lanceolata TaxID=3420 RepID=UPI0040633F66
MSNSDNSSYPTLFRLPNPSQPIPDHPRLQSHEPSLNLPLIDLHNLNPYQLGEACRDWGFFYLINHEIPLTLYNQVENHAKNLFSFPFESKETQFTHPISYFWGTPALTQTVQKTNWVEGFHAPLTQLKHGEVLQEPTLESFRCLLEDYGRHMARVARRIFDAMSKNLALDPVKSASYLSESDGLLRVYRYPHCGDEILGMDAHTDSSVLSILNQDVVGGLQVLRDLKWVDVKPIPGTLVVNLGDMMQAMSSDEYKSVKHRVRVNEKEDRTSICYFVFPLDDSVILSSKYKAFTYNEFRVQVEEDIKSTGFKVGLERFLALGPARNHTVFTCWRRSSFILDSSLKVLAR